MKDNRLQEITHLLDPPTGEPLWHGGATPLGSLRGVTPEQASWKPSPDRASIWDLTLHIAYWKYAVRRQLDGSPKGSFPRKPSNWPKANGKPDGDEWKKDRALLKSEHRRFVEAVAAFPGSKLDEFVEGRKTYRYADLMFGVVAHDIYHVGQIQLLKRLFQSSKKTT